MPTLAKILSEEEKKQLELAQVENVRPEYVEDFGNPDELDSILFRLFAPHAFNARRDYEKKKSERTAHHLWLQTIVQNQESLRVTADRVRQLADAAKNQNNTQNNINSLIGR